ncbi:MAG: branched-chain amino acid ABC transporter permease [Geminicoccaceae bacterium]
MSRDRIAALVILLLAGAAAPLALVLDQPFAVNLLSKALILALAASALNLVLGYGHLVSFGHAAFFGVGGYAVGILSFHHFDESRVLGLAGTDQALIAWPVAAALAGLVALLTGAVAMRTRGAYFIMITLAFAQMAFFVFVSLTAYGGDDGLSLWWGRSQVAGLVINDRLTFFAVVWVALGLWTFLLIAITRSSFGRALVGTAQNETRMAALGFEPYRIRLMAYVISGAVTGLAGALFVELNGFVSPDLVHWSRSGQFMIIVILGGIGTACGPILGALTFVLLEEVFVSLTEHWGFFLGAILLTLVLVAKGGLAGLLLRRAKP